MITTLIELLFYRGLTIHRWNNYPRIENISSLDNIGYCIHVALFLAYLEEKEGRVVDKEFLIKKILFSLFSKLVLSDINSGTINYINDEDPDVLGQLQNRVYKNLFSLENIESIKNDMEKTLEDSNHVLENKIINAARKFCALQESSINSQVFPLVYDRAIEEINMELSKSKKDLPSLTILMSNENYKTYLSQIRRLTHSFRWPGEQRKYKISVMSHLVIVTFLSYVIGKIENDNGKNYNIEEFLLKGIYHDIPEVITGDIITPTKHAIPGFRSTLEKVESKMMKDFFFVYVNADYEESVKNYMLDPFTDEIGKYVKHADIFSMIFESKLEITSENIKFKHIFDELITKGDKINTPSSQYLLSKCIHNFGTSNFNDLLK